MRISLTLLTVTIFFMVSMGLSLADDNAGLKPAGSNKATPSQDTKDKAGRYDYSQHAPWRTKRQSGQGVGYPGYRGQGGAGYPQHRQFADPPLNATADKAVPAGAARIDKATVHHTASDQRRAILHAAAFGDVATLSELLRQGGNPNARARDKTGRTALILASANGHLEVVKSLLAKGAAVDDKDLTGHTALNWASMRSRNEVVNALLKKGADINTKDNNGISPLLYAVGTHNIDMVRLLVANGAELEVETRYNKMTPLLLAIENNDAESINILLNKGANVNNANRDHFSPLMAAAEKGQTEIVRILLARGADANATDTKGRTALMLAKAAKKRDVVKLLLNGGAGSNN